MGTYVSNVLKRCSQYKNIFSLRKIKFNKNKPPPLTMRRGLFLFDAFLQNAIKCDSSITKRHTSAVKCIEKCRKMLFAVMISRDSVTFCRKILFGDAILCANAHLVGICGVDIGVDE